MKCPEGCFEFGGRWVVPTPNKRRNSSAIIICPTCDGTGEVEAYIVINTRGCTKPLTEETARALHRVLEAFYE